MKEPARQINKEQFIGYSLTLLAQETALRRELSEILFTFYLYSLLAGNRERKDRESGKSCETGFFQSFPVFDRSSNSHYGIALGNLELYYFNARFYDATTGRFINVDPVQDGTNWYVYCLNNPLSMVDPTGLDPESTLEVSHEWRSMNRKQRDDQQAAFASKDAEFNIGSVLTAFASFFIDLVGGASSSATISNEFTKTDPHSPEKFFAGLTKAVADNSEAFATGEMDLIFRVETTTYFLDSLDEADGISSQSYRVDGYMENELFSVGEFNDLSFFDDFTTVLSEDTPIKRSVIEGAGQESKTERLNPAQDVRDFTE
jgi:RHS repeat-associated protein